MDNQNMIAEITVDNDATKRCIDVLKELMKVQEKAIKFLVSECIDDSLEGEAITDGLGSAIRAFDGILPEDIYNKVVEIED